MLPVIPRMREYIESMRAIWDCWQNGTRLNYEGEHYNFNLMIPYYDPGPIEQPDLPVYLAAINKRMPTHGCTRGWSFTGRPSHIQVVLRVDAP